MQVSDGEGGDDTIDLTVRVTNVDEPPAITGPGATEYEENGTDSVTTYTAMDPEGAGFDWSLAGDDAPLFTISEAGALAFNAPPDFEVSTDSDADNVYQVTVQATDVDGNVGTLEVAVTVTDVETEAHGIGTT